MWSCGWLFVHPEAGILIQDSKVHMQQVFKEVACIVCGEGGRRQIMDHRSQDTGPKLTGP